MTLTTRQARLARVTAQRVIDARYYFGSAAAEQFVLSLGTVYGVPKDAYAREAFMTQHVAEPVIRQELRKAGLHFVSAETINGVKALANWYDEGDDLVAGRPNG